MIDSAARPKYAHIRGIQSHLPLDEVIQKTIQEPKLEATLV